MKLVGLTGARGFVGRQVLLALHQQGVRVRAVVRGRPAALDPMEAAAETLGTPDLFAATPDELDRLVEGCDTVIHCAWYAKPGQYLTSTLNLQCLNGTLQLAMACTRQGVQRFVGLGTCFEYDVSQGFLDIDSPLKPQTLYAACKAATYHVLTQLLPGQGVSFAWCRLFYLHGEGEDPRRFVPYLRQRMAAGEPADLTSGNQVRDYLDVRDAAAMIVAAAAGPHQGAMNICSGVPVTVRAMAERIAGEYGRRDLLRFGARPDNVFDPPCVVGRK